MAVDDHEMSSTTEAEYKPFPDPLMGTGADVTPASDGGVLKAVRKEGDITEADRPMKGDKVFVHYVGTLTDGTLFDSSRSRNEQFSFTLGEGQVIKAWDLGVATMRRGEIAVLTCKPEYAYGQRSQGKIPAGATLVFEVELFDWKGEDLTDDKDGGVVRRVITAGDGKDTPNEEAKVDVHITGSYEGKEFENRDVEFIITEGKDAGVVAGVELALQRMEKGETASIKVGPKYAYGSEGRPEFNIPGDANLTYKVTLKSFEKAKEPWEMDIEEKLAQSETIKAKGTNYFKQGRFEDALKQWRKIVTYLETETSVEGDNKQKSEAIQLAANLNIAMAALKIKDAVEALSKCDRALELDATNVKAFFRKGQALFHMSDYEQARACFAKVLELEPENKAARNQLSLSNQKIKQYLQKEKRIYGNMFARFAEQDKREKEARERARGDLEVGVFNNGEKKKEGGDGGEGGGAAPGGEEQMEGAEKTAETEDGEKEQLKSEEKQEVEPMQA